jgi:hypothetical protein
MARPINKAMIASHAADTRSSTALPTPRSGPERDVPARKTLGRAYKFREVNRSGNSNVNLCMIPKSGYRFSEKIMRHQHQTYFAGTTSE